MSTVSIIIPVYRTEKYLRQCIDSVLAQTYKNIEIILVDDGSPDASGQICDDYASNDKRVIVIHKVNEGISNARNDGIKRATGDYIFFIDSDDYISPSCIKSLVVVASEGALVVTGYQLDIESESRIYTPTQAYGIYKNMKEYYADFENLFATKYNFVWGKLFRSDIIRNHDILFDKDIALGEDAIFNQAYYEHCDRGVVLISDNGYFYRQCGKETLSKVFNPKMFEWNAFVYRAIRQRLIDVGAYTTTNKRHFLSNVLGNYLYSFRLLALTSSLSAKEKKKYIATYSQNDIYNEALSEVARCKRVDTRLFVKLISAGGYSLYFFLESLKYKIFRR